MAEQNVAVCYVPATGAPFMIELDGMVGSSIEAVVARSGVLQQYPDLAMTHTKVGIFGQLKQWSDAVAAGDRVELYRPITIDPMEARRLRLLKKSQG